MTKIRAMSRRYPPCFKRRWYVVTGLGGFRLRYEGNSCPRRYTNLNEALDAIEQLEALRKLGLVVERVF